MKKRQEEAIERQQKYALRNNREQVALLNERPGAATKERKQLAGK